MSVFLQVRMDIASTDETFEEIVKSSFPTAGAYKMKQLPTLQWKIYTVDPIKRQGCGFYMFKSREAAENRAKEAVFSLQQREGISNVTTQLWEIVEEQTRICKGPIDLPMIQDLPDEE